MKFGALLMMDALGFKGIWRHDSVAGSPETVIQKLETLRRDTEAWLDLGYHISRTDLPKDPGNLMEMVEATYLSDTIALGVGIKDMAKMLERHPQPWATGKAEELTSAAAAMAVFFACEYASVVMGFACISSPPLAYRGCISFGQFDMKDRFIVGPAVDEAASSMDAAQGSFVWLLPSAVSVFGRYREEAVRNSNSNYGMSYMPYQVPLKGGDRYATFAVTPFLTAGSEQGATRIRNAILATFKGSLDVQVKMQNTEKFFDHWLDDWHRRGE